MSNEVHDNGLSPHLMAVYCPETMDQLGKLLSVILGWSGIKILELCAVALTNANFHDAAAAVWNLHARRLSGYREDKKGHEALLMHPLRLHRLYPVLRRAGRKDIAVPPHLPGTRR